MNIRLSSIFLLSVTSSFLWVHLSAVCSFAFQAPDGRIKIVGKVVDDETGKPITQMMIQAGRMDPDDPRKVTWGYSERNTKSKTGRFSTTVRWSQGWTARIIADGYEPQPVIREAPKLGQKEIEVEIRLKPGKPIRGIITDHLGKPVSGINVFSISPRGLNLYGGNSHDRYDDKIDTGAKFVTTKADGTFELPSGGAAPSCDFF